MSRVAGLSDVRVDPSRSNDHVVAVSSLWRYLLVELSSGAVGGQPVASHLVQPQTIQLQYSLTQDPTHSGLRTVCRGRRLSTSLSSRDPLFLHRRPRHHPSHRRHSRCCVYSPSRGEDSCFCHHHNVITSRNEINRDVVQITLDDTPVEPSMRRVCDLS